jgi:hypothetical protein
LGRGLKYVSHTFCIGGGASTMYSNTFYIVSESWCQ